MKKGIQIILGVIIFAVVSVVLAGVIKFNFIQDDIYIEQLDGTIIALNDLEESGPHNVTYNIDGEFFTLVNGVSEKDASFDSTFKVVTKYFGNATNIDLDKDGREDSVFLLTQNSGGTGTFFYVVAALNTVDGWRGSQAFFLGDRIAPQVIEISHNPSHDNVVVVNYMDRGFDEPMASDPSIEKNVWVKFSPEDMSFGEVVQDFEGEANPDTMTLDMKTWRWVKAIYNNDTEFTPNDIDVFTINFKNDGTFSSTTDCNSVGGDYAVDGRNIMFGENFVMTRMFCADSQEQDFVSLLGEIQSFFFTSKGELVFELKYDTGSVIFR